MNQEEIEKHQKEKQEIIQKVQELDNQRNQLVTRLAEINGVLKFLSNQGEKEEQT